MFVRAYIRGGGGFGLTVKLCIRKNSPLSVQSERLITKFNN